LLFVFNLFCSVVSGAPAPEVTKKEYREAFLSPALQKDYYKIMMQTVRFFDHQQSAVNLLIESFRGSSTYSYDMFTQAFCTGKEGSLDAQSFTYDGAVAALSFLMAGQATKAERILRVYRQEFYYVKVDAIGLYNSYRTDMPLNRYGGLTPGIDGDRTHLGPTMWVAIAALQYTAVTGDLHYLSLAIDMATWARQLNHYRFADGQKGGVCMGFGWGPDWSQVYSTENNVDYYAVLCLLKEIYSRGDHKVKNIYENKNLTPQAMATEMNGLDRWFKEVVYDPGKNAFHCGYNENGVDTTAALDTISWTIAALGPKKLDDMGINPFLLMNYAEKSFKVFNRIGEQKVEGFDFTNATGRKSPVRVIWIEGTGFQTVTYQLMARYAAKLGLAKKADEYLQKAVKYSDEMEKVSRAAHLIEYALPYVARRLGEKEILTTFNDDWEIPRGNKGQWVASSSSTAWRLFALMGFNPLEFDENNIHYRYFDRPVARGR